MQRPSTCKRSKRKCVKSAMHCSDVALSLRGTPAKSTEIRGISDSRGGIHGTHLGIIRCGASRMARHPKAQNA